SRRRGRRRRARCTQHNIGDVIVTKHRFGFTLWAVAGDERAQHSRASAIEMVARSALGPRIDRLHPLFGAHRANLTLPLRANVLRWKTVAGGPEPAVQPAR